MRKSPYVVALILSCSAVVVLLGQPTTSARTAPTTQAEAIQAPLVTDAQRIEKNATESDTISQLAPLKVGESVSDKVAGILTFRGNASRSFLGTGPVGQRSGQVSWRYPRSAMCGKSSEYGEIRTWCGTGWAGQPAVFEREGRTWVAFGAYDYKVHFVDAATGQDIIPAFATGDIAKGMVTVDPDGYPIVYQGSRDNMYRAIAIDGDHPRELWRMDARSFKERQWNNDWDAGALILKGLLIETGENSRIHVVKLNRAYDADGKVSMKPQLLWSAPGWDQQLLRDVGDNRVSAESSPTVIGNTVYFTNSGGLLQGWDLTPLLTGVGKPERVLRFWLGDDADSTLVADSEGFLYAGVEVDRNTARAKVVGQMLKIDPRKPENPVVWSIDVNHGVDSGVWSTPAVWRDLVIWTTKPGHVVGVRRADGQVAWDLRIGGMTLSSPVVVDDTLLQGDGAGVLRAWSLNETKPVEIWRTKLSGNIESTMAVWRGSIYVGTRGGYFYKVSTNS